MSATTDWILRRQDAMADMTPSERAEYAAEEKRHLLAVAQRRRREAIKQKVAR
jgi:hypothetical protein